MKRSRLILMSALTALLLGCSSTATYMPAEKTGGKGYSHVALEQDRYRVTFKGGDQTAASDFALRRAAELTLEQGKDWFLVTNAFAGKPKNVSDPGVGRVGGVIGGAVGRTVGVGIGLGVSLANSNQDAIHNLEILMGAGPKPEDPNAYDARSVQASLSQRDASAQTETEQ